MDKPAWDTGPRACRVASTRNPLFIFMTEPCFMRPKPSFKKAAIKS